MRLVSLLILAGGGVAACGQLGMDRQPKYSAQAAAPSLPNQSEVQEAPAGVVAVGQPQRDAEALIPPPVTVALLQRGRTRYAIACAPCHGANGDGDGEVVARGFPAPPSFSDARLSALSGAHVFDVISNGYGVMAPQAERVAPADRWAIVAYVRALDLTLRTRKPTA